MLTIKSCKLELKPCSKEKKILSVSQFVMHVICSYACHLNFKLLQINKNRILSLFRREEMFVRMGVDYNKFW